MVSLRRSCRIYTTSESWQKLSFTSQFVLEGVCDARTGFQSVNQRPAHFTRTYVSCAQRSISVGNRSLISGLSSFPWVFRVRRVEMGQMFEGRCFFFLFSFSFFFKTVPAEPLESTLSISLFFLFFFWCPVPSWRRSWEGYGGCRVYVNIE